MEKAMTRNGFMWALSNALAGFPQSEINRITEYYDELFTEAVEEGKTEEEICASLGKPEDIAEGVRVELAFVRAEQKPTPKSMNAVLWILLGVFAFPVGIPLAIALFGIIFGLFIAAFSIMVSFFAAAVALGAAAIAMLVSGIVIMVQGAAMFGLCSMGVSFILAGLSLLFGIGSFSLGRASLRGIVKFCRWAYEGISKKIGSVKS